MLSRGHPSGIVSATLPAASLLTKSIEKGQKANMSLFSKLRPDGAANALADARPRWGRFLVVGVLALGLAGGVAACGDSSDSASGDSGSIDLIGYSTPQVVYEDTLEPDFQGTDDGEGVDFANSFAASGDQSRAVEAGQPADIVHFSVEPDMQRVVDSGAVADDWDKNEYNGIVEDSVVVFVVRSGNPENIQDWDDIVQEGIEVVTPNPFQSGSAKWNLLAAYGAKINQGASEQEAEDFLAQLLANAPTQPASARDATAAFTSGKGDVLLSYENEAIAAQEAGEDVEYVIPDDTILIETPIAVTEDAGPEAQAFVDYLYTDEAQQAWADAGYRPVVESVLEDNRDKFPDPPGLFTSADLGGWPKLNADFFDPEGSIVQQIEEDLGVATE
jgi:sulfate/thiosulfate transport system substrate-binding protein